MINVIETYQSKKTSFAQSLEPITELPTVVICLYERKSDFYLPLESANITYKTGLGTKTTLTNQKQFLVKDNETVEIHQYNDKMWGN